MRRWLWWVLGGAVVASAAFAVVAVGRGPEVTTVSPAARAELEAALDASMKFYHEEARQHLERALALDPDFVLAKLLLVERLHGDSERRQRLVADVAAADLDRLSERERFMVRRALALYGKRSEEAEQILEDYLARHPNDPFALEMKAMRAFSRGETAAAEQAYRRLIEVGPNWVIAYNQLGYLAMRQGRFAEAEEHLVSYRFIAPDQANPHDSLGELYTLVGRYDEAVASLEQAIRTKPDFWYGYEHLALAHLMRRDWSAAAAAVERMAAAGCPEDMVESIRCEVRLRPLALAGQWQQLLDVIASSCPKAPAGGDGPPLYEHLALVGLGRFDRAAELEAELRSALDDKGVELASGEKGAFFKILLLRLEGMRLAGEGAFDEAAARLREADALMGYNGAGPGLARLFVKLQLAEALQAAGRDAEAGRVVAEVRAVNPSLAGEAEAGSLRLLVRPAP